MGNLARNGHFRRRRVQATVLAVGVCAILAGTAMGKPEAPAITGATQKLFEAIASNNLGAAQAALAAGADLMGRNRAGQTPIEAANQRARYEIAHFLLLEKNGRRTGIAKAEAAKPAPVPAVRVITPAEPTKLAGPFDPTRAPVATLPVIGTIREPIMVAAAPSSMTAVAPTRDAINARPSTETPSKNWFSRFLDSLWSSGGSSGITMVVSAPESPNADMVPSRESTTSWTHASPTSAAAEPKSTGLLALLFGLFSSSDNETPAPVTEIAAETPTPSSMVVPKLASPKPAVQPLLAQPAAPVKLAQGQVPSIPSARAANDVAVLVEPSAAPAPVVGPAIVAVRKEPETTLTTITRAAPVSTSAEAEATIAEGQGLWARIIKLFAAPTTTAPTEIPAPQAPMVASIGNYDRVTGTLAATPMPAPLDVVARLPAATPPTPAAHAVTPPAQPAVIDRLVAGIGEFGRVFARVDATEHPATVAAADASAHLNTSVNPPASPAVIDRLVAGIGEFGRVFGRLDATAQPAPVVVAQDPAPTDPRSVPPAPSASVPTPRIALNAQNGLARMSEVSVFDRFFGWLEATPHPVIAEAPVERLPIATRTPPSAPIETPVARREPSRTTLAPVMAGAKDKDTPLELANLPPTTDTDVPTMSTAGHPLLGVALTLGETTGLDAVLAASRGRRDPGSRGPCIRKREGKTAYCIETIDWNAGVGTHFDVSTVLFQGPRAVVRYDDGRSTTVYTQFSTEAFDSIVGHYRERIGDPTETWTRRIAPMAAERRANPTQVWRSRNPQTGETTVLEVRKYDDTRGGFPDLRHGAVMLYRDGAEPLFPRLSPLELMSLR